MERYPRSISFLSLAVCDTFSLCQNLVLDLVHFARRAHLKHCPAMTRLGARNLNADHCSFMLHHGLLLFSACSCFITISLVHVFNCPTIYVGALCPLSCLSLQLFDWAYSGQPGCVAPLFFYFKAFTFCLATAAIREPVTCQDGRCQRVVSY